MIKSRLVVATVLSVIAYLGLAIVGAGGAGRFFSYPPLVAVSVVTIALGVASLFSEGHIGSGVKEDRSNRWVVAVFGVLGILDAYLPAYSDRVDFLTFGGEGVRWLGFVLYTSGGILRLAPVFVLGRRFSGLVAIQPEHRLVSSGLYGAIRHPSYLGLFILMLGWGVAFRSGLGVVIAVLSLVVVLARIRAEERLLSESFGAEYDAYRARTWRLIPYLY
jgi:protein-S-isoprenylcysteine O-methyltransferase Ste14